MERASLGLIFCHATKSKQKTRLGDKPPRYPQLRGRCPLEPPGWCIITPIFHERLPFLRVRLPLNKCANYYRIYPHGISAISHRVSSKTSFCQPCRGAVCAPVGDRSSPLHGGEEPTDSAKSCICSAFGFSRRLCI